MMDSRDIEGIVKETFGLGPHIKGIKIISVSGDGFDGEVPFKGDPIALTDENGTDRVYVRIIFEDTTPTYYHGVNRVERKDTEEEQAPNRFCVWVYIPSKNIENWTIHLPQHL